MAKMVTDISTTSAQDSKKQRKKQAKREAKLMLKLDQARQDVQKAEQKVAKAQANLEVAHNQVHDLEERLAQLHTSQENHVVAPGHPNGTPEQPVDTSYVTQQPATEQVHDTGEVVPPAEGRSDIPAGEENPADCSATTEQQESIVEMHHESIPPAEGRVDVSQEDVGTRPADEVSAKQEEPASNTDTGYTMSSDESTPEKDEHHTRSSSRSRRRSSSQEKETDQNKQ
jgi:hypothetical protein